MTTTPPSCQLSHCECDHIPPPADGTPAQRQRVDRFNTTPCRELVEEATNESLAAAFETLYA